MTARRKPEPPKFKPGDVVRLRSGSPPMTVTGNGFQTGRGAIANRSFVRRASDDKRNGVDRIVHVAFVSTRTSRTEDRAEWRIASDEIHENALEMCPPATDGRDT